MIKRKPFRKRQAGFTLVEVLITVALIGVLAGSAIYYIDFGAKKEQIEVVSLQTWITQNMQRAIIARFTTNGNSLASTTKAQLVATGDVTTRAPGDIAWNVQGTPTADTITIRIVTASSAAATTLHAQISSLAGTGVVDSTSKSNANIDISYEI